MKTKKPSKPKGGYFLYKDDVLSEYIKKNPNYSTRTNCQLIGKAYKKLTKEEKEEYRKIETENLVKYQEDLKKYEEKQKKQKVIKPKVV